MKLSSDFNWELGFYDSLSRQLPTRARLVGESEAGIKQQFKTKLGLTIAKRRIKLKMTQLQLATASKIHRTYLCALEKGECNVTVLTLNNIADALGLSSSYLLRACEPE